LRFEDLYDIEQGFQCKNLVDHFERRTHNMNNKKERQVVCMQTSMTTVKRPFNY